MARYKPYDYRQTKMLPVRFEEQILPGTFESTLNRLIDESIDLTVFEARYRNDEGGAPACDPAVLLNHDEALRSTARLGGTGTVDASGSWSRCLRTSAARIDWIDSVTEEGAR